MRCSFAFSTVLNIYKLMCVFINAKYISFCNHTGLEIFSMVRGVVFAQVDCPPQDTRGIPEVVNA